MLFNEVKFLGINFMIVRWILTVAAIFAMAYLTAMFVKKTDLPVDESVSNTLEIKEEYCIGCGICVNMLPDYYEMENNKAVVRKNPEGIHVLKAINESINKCPAKAIVLNK